MKRSRIAAAAVVLALSSAGLAGCADEVPEVPEPVEQPTAVESPNLDSEQVGTVLEDVMKVVKEGDEAKDSELLAPRVKDPALTLRAGYYQLAKVKEKEVPEFVLDEDSATVTNTDEWPRAIVVPTIEDEGELPKLAFITQDSARDDYKLESWVRMYPGKSVQTVEVSEGSRVVPNDSTDYLLSPTDALAAWAGRLDGEGENADLIAEDEFTKSYQAERDKLDEASGESGEVTFKASPAESPITAVQLVDGKALVSGHITYTVTHKRTDERANYTIGGYAGELMEDPMVGDQPVEITYLVSVALVVPEQVSGALIEPVGAERVIRSIKRIE
ncbi:MAG: hypothetical protein Q4D87_02765 [Actinomycetaceae bacterium]|nr:hypothetical protein [Actinomycetaceae bacterium]